MKIKSHFENLDPIRRRRFLQLLGTVLASPMLPGHLRLAGIDLVGGGDALAASLPITAPTIFISILLRDQWDWGQAILPPSLGTNFGALRRGTNPTQTALYNSTVTKEINNFYLSENGVALRPHLDSIAVLDTCELNDRLGRIHGHNGMGAVRSPGCGTSQAGGRQPAYLLDFPDCPSEPNGGERIYATTPTPECVHNYYQKILTPGIANGFSLKYVARNPVHCAYHFSADLNSAQIERYTRIDQLVRDFNSAVKTDAAGIAKMKEEITLVADVLKKLDARFFTKYGKTQGLATKHADQQEEAFRALIPTERKPVDLALTPEKYALWNDGIPKPNAGPRIDNMEFGSLMHYASTVAISGQARTIAVEWDYVDHHGTRSNDVMSHSAITTSVGLARLIDSLKAAGIYDRTLIALTQVDGGRSLLSESYGDSGKVGVMLAGGMIKGGYYGDIRVAGDTADGHVFAYVRPDVDTGLPIVNGSTGNDGRLNSADVWRTIMEALKIPTELAAAYPATKDGRVFKWLLRS